MKGKINAMSNPIDDQKENQRKQVKEIEEKILYIYIYMTEMIGKILMITSKDADHNKTI
jgi:hypothetical protein